MANDMKENARWRFALSNKLDEELDELSIEELEKVRTYVRSIKARRVPKCLKCGEPLQKCIGGDFCYNRSCEYYLKM